MRNPWIEKNTLMSMWLSAANRMTGAAQGQVAASAKRQIAWAQKDLQNQVMQFWTGRSTKSAGKRKSRR